jgi:signal transduction histidine kinase/FixJ family two-component response regulator
MPIDQINNSSNTLMSNELQVEEMKRIMTGAGLGMWSVEFFEGLSPRMILDAKMAELFGIKDVSAMSPEEVYDFWLSKINPEDKDSVMSAIDRMKLGNVEEITCLWGDRYLRFTGSGRVVEGKGQILTGYCSDVTNLVFKEKEQKKAMAQMGAELRRAYEIVQFVSRSCTSIYNINMLTGRYKRVSTELKKVDELLGEEGDVREGLQKLCENIVKPEWKETMLAFTNLDRVREQLKTLPIVKQEFEGTIRGWAIGSFVAGKRGEDGYCTEIVWTTVDVNEQKLRELSQLKALEEAKRAAIEANRAKSTFLFNMSHDIRTPMNAIIGFTGLLEKHQDEPGRRNDYLNKLKEASALLLGLINNVLEMSRIEKGHLDLDIQAWGVEQMYDSFCSVFLDMMVQKGITFCHSMDVEHEFLFCDPIKVRDVIMNLISNAYKYTPRGGKVELYIRQYPCEEEGYVMMETIVKDNGRGISAEFLPHLFEEFTREHSTTDIKVEGTGLGMPIVKNLLDLMGGTIEVESAPGKGTTFKVYLKHRIAQKSDLLNVDMPDLSDVDFKGRRILLAEDNDLNAEIAIEILKDVGLVVDRANDGLQCVEMMEAAPSGYYDLVLMDIQMPRMNGYEATRIIRQMDDKVKANVTILAMTANAFEEDKREAIKSGMNAHLSKPIEVDKLVKTLKRSLNSRK